VAFTKTTAGQGRIKSQTRLALVKAAKKQLLPLRANLRLQALRTSHLAPPINLLVPIHQNQPRIKSEPKAIIDLALRQSDIGSTSDQNYRYG